MRWHICCCDPVAMATTAQRQITPVLISINGKTGVIYTGPLSTKGKAAFHFCITDLVVAKFNMEENSSTFYSENQKKKKINDRNQLLVFHCSADLSCLMRRASDLFF